MRRSIAQLTQSLEDENRWPCFSNLTNYSITLTCSPKPVPPQAPLESDVCWHNAKRRSIIWCKERVHSRADHREILRGGDYSARKSNGSKRSERRSTSQTFPSIGGESFTAVCRSPKQNGSKSGKEIVRLRKSVSDLKLRHHVQSTKKS